jgi:RNA polymerase sigma factor (sigma-70 family)
LAQVVEHARRLARAEALTLTDGELLARFVARRDEAAFEMLLERHGPMVLGVCRRLLGHHDAEDAFQATFLVLVRRAGALGQPDRVGNWLHGVAYHIALAARARRARRETLSRQTQAPPQAEPPADTSQRELCALLDEELARLPEKYRAPLILCHLEGQTHEAAARALRIPLGSISWRLSRALELLRGRLTRRGVALPAVALAAAVPSSLHASTLSVGMLVAAEPGAVPARVAALMQGVFHSLPVPRLRLVAMLLLTVGLIGAGAVFAERAAQTPPRGQAAPVADGKDRPALTDAEGDALPPGALLRLGTSRLRHGARVLCVAYSPDGTILASGGGDHAVRLWDARTGKALRELRGHLDGTSGLAFSPDGKTLISGGTFDCTIRLWEVATGKELWRVKAPNAFPHGEPTSLRFSPDGQTVVSGSWDICLWDAATGKELRRFDGHRGRVLTVAFSLDGQRLASRDWDDRTIRLWDVATGRELHQLRDDQHQVNTVLFSPDGKALACGCHDGTIRLWDVASGKELRPFVRHSHMVTSLAFSAGGKGLVSGSYDRTVRLWDVASGKQLRLLGKHHYLVNDVALSPDGKTVASAGDDNLVRLWDLATGRELLRGEGHEHSVCDLAVSPDSRTLASGGNDGTLRLWDTATGKLRWHRRVEADGQKVVSLSYSPDGKMLASLSGPSFVDTTVRLWDVASGKELHRWPGPQSLGGLVAFSPDGKTVAAARGDGLLRIRETATGKDTAGSDKEDGVDLSDLSATRLPWARPVFAPDGSTFLMLVVTADSGDLAVQIRDAVSGQVLRKIPLPKYPSSLALSADGKLLAAGRWQEEAGQEQIQLLEVASGKRLCRLPGHLQGEYLAVSPDGRLLAAAGRRPHAGGLGDDRTIRVMDVAAGKEVRRFVGHYGRVTALTFSADGKRLISGGSDTMILVWDVAGLGEPARRERLSSAQLEGLWADLAGAGGEKVHEAICRLADAPAQAPAFLAERLRPAPVVERRRVTELVGQLGSPRFEARQQAMRELEKAGEVAAAALREALSAGPPLEVRRRVEQLLSRLEGWTPEWLRAYRALLVLERLATPEALRLLRSLADGAPEARLTREVRGCLLRLARRAGS